MLDGVPYTVTFNIRDKGADQYQYLIEFKENKTPGLSNTAVKSLLRTDQASYKNIVSDAGKNVKRQVMQQRMQVRKYSLDTEHHATYDDGGKAYERNAVLQGEPGYEATAETDFWVQNVTSALKKFPEFVGRIYRNLRFGNIQDLEVFLERHTIGSKAEVAAFVSASKNPNGYVVPGDHIVHMVIDGASGRDISESFGIPAQQEVCICLERRSILRM